MFVSFTGRYLRLSVHELPQNDKLIGVDPAKESTFKKMEKQNCTKTMETGLNNMFSSFLGVTWTDLRILRNSKEGHLGNPKGPLGHPEVATVGLDDLQQRCQQAGVLQAVQATEMVTVKHGELWEIMVS